MSIQLHCKHISLTLTKHIRLATSNEQRNAYAAAALEEIGKRIFPELETLLMVKGETSDDYRLAREAVLELVTFVTIPFVRNCSDYRWGVALLEELANKSGHSQVKKKLVIYSNQLKQRWNEAEPGGVAHNPRAKRVWPLANESNKFANALRITLLLVIVLYFFSHLDLTSLIFPRWNELRPQRPAPQMQADRQHDAEPPVILHVPDQPPADAASQAPMTSGNFYSYTDDRGILHIVDDFYKVPQEYRQGMTVTKTATSPEMPVTVTPNGHALVPVILSYHGRSVRTTLLLDTGASITSISEETAAQLGIQPEETIQRISRVADGRQVVSRSAKVDTLTVGSKLLSNPDITIMPHEGPREGHDGLLGMNFLRNYRYYVDYKRHVIVWQ